MKQISFLFAALIISSIAKAQCEAPEIVDWVNVGDTAFAVSFMSEVAGPYELEVTADYGISDFEFTPLVLSGDAEIGLNSIEVVVNENLNTNPNINLNSPSEIYFSGELKLECEPGVFSDSTKFYMSAHSIAGESSFSCDSLYQPFETLPDGAGFSYSISFTVPDNGDVVESLSAFTDIGHTYNGDLSIVLTHPNGTEVALLDFATNNELGGSFGFSVIFTDEADQEVANTGDENAGPKGIYLPAEPLSVLIGEPMAGDWILTVTDNLSADDGMVFGICLTLNGIPCIASVEGTTFFDFNSNGAQDDNEPGYPYAYILNSISDDQFYSGEDGGFLNCTEEGSGTLGVLNVPEYYQSNPVDITVAENDQQTGIIIPITTDEVISDISVDLFSLEPNRPGFEATYLAQVSNVGTICQDDVNLSLSFPDFVEIVSSGNPDLIFSGNTATMEVGEVCPFAPLTFNFVILLDDTVSLGTMLEATISANVSDEDPNELNNTFTSSVIVVGSYDPNDKQVSEDFIGDAFLEDGAPLKYTVRFQNTGTFYAERVVIADTIDADLDLNSLHIISTSHNMQLVREGNVLYFEFDQIFLPDSATDFDGSIGYVRYEITPNANFSEGDLIENTAYIYFDFNEPIITNTVVTGFQNPLSISNEVEFETRLFPNPANQNITISWAQDVEVDRIETYDLSGRLLQENTIRNSSQTTLDVSDLASGIYLLKVNAGGLISSSIFMKE